MADQPTILTLIVNALAVGATWIAGEGGRVAVAGGAGGLARWFSAEKRRVRDGVIAAAGGSLAAIYLWPLFFAVISRIFGGLETNTNNIAMAAFIAGAFGMSGVKVAMAMVEARMDKKGGKDA